MLDESTIAGATPDCAPAANAIVRFAKQRSASTYGYAFLVAALLSGWMLKDEKLVNPDDGPGYWLGIVGGSMMLFLLLYPLRKKIPILRVFGAVKHWFRIHMIFGLVGPLLVLFHSNFNTGSFNSQVALYCMLLVSVSGMVGRHFYAGIHRGLYGKKTSLRELQEDMTETLEANNGLATLMPNLVACLEVLSVELQGDAITRSIGMRRCLRWMMRRYVIRFQLKRIAKKDLLERAASSPVIAKDIKRLRRSANTYINGYVKQMSCVAHFSLYERLFSLWHVLHLPLFLMLVLSACVHVIAVHMY